MATPTLIEIAGASDANSYVSLAEAVAYHESRLFNDAWVNAGNPEKIKALIWATRVLDRVRFKGFPATSSQALRWPRIDVENIDGELLDSESIPTQIANATCELALLLLTSDRTVETGTEGFEEIRVGPISLKMASSDRIKPISNEINSLLVGLTQTGLEVSRG